MTDIVVNFKNHVYCEINTADVGILQEMSDYFTFEQPGARFMPTYKAKLWDGKVRLLNMFSRELYVGLIPYVRLFAEQNNYTITVEAAPGIADPYVDVKEFIAELNLHSRGQPLESRDYQLDAISHGIHKFRALLLSPTGSGKSMIIYCLARWHLNQNRRILIVVPTTSLVEQLTADFADYSSENAWQTSEHVHKIYAGHEKTTDRAITISTWQSIYKLGKDFFANFDVVIGDEAHQFKATSLTSILNKMPHCAYRIGTTGTLDNLQTNKLVLEGIFGAVHRVITTKKLIDGKQLADLKIHCVVLQYPEEVKKAVRSHTYQEEMNFLTQYSARNKFIRNLALAQKGNTLVLFQYVEKHGKVLHADIIAKAADGRQVFFVHGGTDTDVREKIRHITEQESDAIIVASYGTFSTGINIRNLHNIIFASPTKSKIRNLQSIGRGLRTHDSKAQCNLYDIGDDLSYKSKKNFTLLHMAERIKLYNDEQFDYTLNKVTLA